MPASRTTLPTRIDRKLNPSVAGCAGAVVDHNLLPQPLAEPGPDQPRRDIVSAAISGPNQ